MKAKELAGMLHPYERKVLPLVEKHKDFKELVKASKLKDVEVMRGLQWLENKKLIEKSSLAVQKVVIDKNFKYSTENASTLSKDEIKKVLKSLNVF